MRPEGHAVRVAVVRTGTANLASVIAGLRRAGAVPHLVDQPGDVDRATHLVLPGVGTFGAAMASLRSGGLVGPLEAWIAAGRPLLAICLGMQLLAARSEESPGVEGLAVVPADIRRLQPPVRIPQLGWNTVVAEPGARLVRSGCAYFANSYCLWSMPDGWTGATTEHGQPFVSAVERGALLGCQFHPELSGAWGLDVIRRWLSSEDRC